MGMSQRLKNKAQNNQTVTQIDIFMGLAKTNYYV
jgi:hypothetical protein